MFERIAIVGSGAVGLYYGGRLAEHGHDVTFLMRSDAEIARRQGIIATSVHGDFFLPQPQVADDPSDIGPVDLVIVAWKATSNHLLEKILPPLMHDRTQVVTLQNGLGNCEAIADVVGDEHVMGALCFVCINRIAPAKIDHTAGGRIAVAEYSKGEPGRAAALAEMFASAKVDACTELSVEGAVWKKLLWNVPFNGLSITEGGITTDLLLADPEIVARMRRLMYEVRSIGMARGFTVDESLIEWNIQRTYPMAAYRPSSMIDWQEGRAVEVDAIWGEPLRRGLELGLDLPELKRLCSDIRRACG